MGMELLTPAENVGFWERRQFYFCQRRGSVLCLQGYEFGNNWSGPEAGMQWTSHHRHATNAAVSHPIPASAEVGSVADDVAFASRPTLPALIIRGQGR